MPPQLAGLDWYDCALCSRGRGVTSTAARVLLTHTLLHLCAALCDALTAVRGTCKPFSICGSLPLVDDLQRAGFDMQITGFGLSSTYHADNEYALFSDLKNGYRVFGHIVAALNGL